MLSPSVSSYPYRSRVSAGFVVLPAVVFIVGIHMLAHQLARNAGMPPPPGESSNTSPMKPGLSTGQLLTWRVTLVAGKLGGESQAKVEWEM